MIFLLNTGVHFSSKLWKKYVFRCHRMSHVWGHAEAYSPSPLFSWHAKLDIFFGKTKREKTKTTLVDREDPKIIITECMCLYQLMEAGRGRGESLCICGSGARLLSANLSPLVSLREPATPWYGMCKNDLFACSCSIIFGRFKRIGPWIFCWRPIN